MTQNTRIIISRSSLDRIWFQHYQRTDKMAASSIVQHDAKLPDGQLGQCRKTSVLKAAIAKGKRMDIMIFN